MLNSTKQFHLNLAILTPFYSIEYRTNNIKKIKTLKLFCVKAYASCFYINNFYE